MEKVGIRRRNDAGSHIWSVTSTSQPSIEVMGYTEVATAKNRDIRGFLKTLKVDNPPTQIPLLKARLKELVVKGTVSMTVVEARF